MRGNRLMSSTGETGTHDLEAERDYWRTLIEVTNAVVTKRDVAGLRAAIAPNVQRLVPHDHTNLYLFDEKNRLESFVLDPSASPWPDAVVASIHTDAEPFTSRVAPVDRTVDIDVEHADPAGWELLHAHVLSAGVRRI